jgi:PIN domain nuclease of toxin-antitoxin system
VRLLLDTHIWLWSLLEPARLTRRVARALEDKENELWLSPLSVWELLILVEKGRLTVDLPVEQWIERAMKAGALKEAPITQEVALETRRVALPHRDPADRFIAATARVLDLTVVTADRNLLALRGLSTLPNR